MAYITSQGHKRPRRPSHALPGEVRVQKKPLNPELSTVLRHSVLLSLAQFSLGQFEIFFSSSSFWSLLFCVAAPTNALPAFYFQMFTFYILHLMPFQLVSSFFFPFVCLHFLSVSSSFFAICFPSFLDLPPFLFIVYTIIPHTLLCCLMLLLNFSAVALK